jgi:hypothetical protein
MLSDLALRLTITHIHDDVRLFYWLRVLLVTISNPSHFQANFLNGEFTGLPSWILSQSTTIAPYITTMKNHLCDLAAKEIVSI